MFRFVIVELVFLFICLRFSGSTAFQTDSRPFSRLSKYRYGNRIRASVTGSSSCTDSWQLKATSDGLETKSLQSLLIGFQSKNPGCDILDCDADQVQTMNAALWATLADLSKDDSSQKVCIVLEKIPVGALSSFVTDYASIQMEDRLLAHLPELERINISLLGGGNDVQPALVIETKARTPAEMANQKSQQDISIDEAKCTAALKSFVESMVIGLEACPYTKTPDLSATGLEKRGVTPGPVAYRFCAEADACAAVAAFWASVNELLSVPEAEISTTLLSLPAIGAGIAKEDHDRFAAVVELISRNLCLFRGDGAVGLVHFHPAYERNLVQPVDKPAFGHLPPPSWLRPMLRLNGNDKAAESLTEEDLSVSNYQRRAPHTMINVLRASQLNAAVGAKSIVDLELDNGTTEKASGIPLYSRNAIRLAGQGREKLQSELEAIWEKYQ